MSEMFKNFCGTHELQKHLFMGIVIGKVLGSMLTAWIVTKVQKPH